MLPSSFWLVPSDVSLDSKDRICRAFVSLALAALLPLCFMQGGSCCPGLIHAGNIVQRQTGLWSECRTETRCVLSDSSIDYSMAYRRQVGPIVATTTSTHRWVQLVCIRQHSVSSGSLDSLRSNWHGRILSKAGIIVYVRAT
jgi:hypothetical protein